MIRYVDVAFNIPVKGAFTYAVELPEQETGGDTGEHGAGAAAPHHGAGAAKHLQPEAAAAEPQKEEGTAEHLQSEPTTAGTDRTRLLGYRVVAPFGKRQATGFVVGERSERPAGVEQVRELKRIVGTAPLFDEGYLELARWVASMYYASLGETLAAMTPGGRQERELPALGSDDAAFEATPVTLSAEQEEAIARIGAEGGGRYYVFGITGSGKTEVFLRAASAVMGQGKSVIYLVPEIALTQQVAETIKARFAEAAAIIHSRLTPSQRLSEWMRIKRGDAKLVVGARSAVFAPVSHLGLIVVDEEHEGSYKSGQSPRYHARQVAMKRCADAGAALVMGSATPSVEAWHLMSLGKLTPIRLTRRLAGGSMPAMEIVDLKEEEGPLTETLLQGIRETHAEGRQSILFLNRRGFSYFFHCKSCGFVMQCRRCSVTLTYHKARGRMICHYCGYRVKPVESCPECGSVDVGYGGFGTEGIEDELQRRLPEISIARVDTDTIRKRGSLEEVLQSFRRGETQLLLGTQMVAKGLNFPGVKLVGLIHADTGLLLPDFRAAERTFSLITQVSGRAGRYSPDGRVIIQTLRPQNPAVTLAARGEYDAFYEQEIRMREALRFPPYARLIRLVFRGPNAGRVHEGANSFADRLSSELPETDEILGPAECPIAKISHNYRVQLILRSARFRETHRLLGTALESFKPPTRVHIEADVDPVSLL
jgi:primosomal protein N' (replication factor Y)